MNRLNIFSCGVARELWHFSSPSLAFRGFFLFLLRICWRDDVVALWVGKEERFGEQPLFAFYG